MGKQIDAETREKIVQTYLENEGMSYAKVAEHFGISASTAFKIVNREPPTDSELDRIHEDKMDKHPRTSDWMQHITPLHKHKQALELAIEHKQAELDAAKQELRDFTATLRQLMEGDV